MKFVLLSLGMYYLTTGLWSITDIESFSLFTNYRGDFFLKHTAGVLFFTLGSLFTFFSLKDTNVIEISFFALTAIFGVMVVELYYLPTIGNPLPFWADFVLEAVFALLLIIFQTLYFLKKSAL